MVFTRKKNKDCIAYFDIGSSSVWGAVVHYDHDKNTPPEILYATRRCGGARTLSDMAPLIAEVGDDLFREAERYAGHSIFGTSPFSSSVCVLSAPWQRSTIANFSERFEEPMTVTEKFLKPLLERVALDQLEEYAGEGAEDLDLSHIQLIEHEVLSARLNGYPTRSIFDRTVDRIELAGYISVCSSQAHREFGRWIKDAVGREPSFRAHPALAHRTLRLLFPDHKDLVYVSVTDAATEVVVVSVGEISTVKSFAVGYGDLIRAVSESYDVPTRTAHSMLKLFSDSMMSTNGSKEMASTLREVEEKWAATFISKVGDGVLSGSVPFFFTSHESLATLYSSIPLGSEKKQGEKRTVLDPDMFRSLVQNSAQISDVPALMGIAALNSNGSSGS